MNPDCSIRLFAGVMVLANVMPNAFVSPPFVLFNVFIGANLIPSSFSGFCPAALVFRTIGIKKGSAFE